LKGDDVEGGEKMENEKYNGWTNRETWAFNLWLTNNEGDYNYWKEQAKQQKDANKLAQELKEFLEDLWISLIDNPAETTREARLMLQDIGDIDNINYYEVAQAFLEE